MKRKIISIICLGLIITLIIPTCTATPTEWHNMPKIGKDIGEIFQLKFEIKSDETTNYTITLDLDNQFSAVDGNSSMTVNIPIDSTRTFIFDLEVNEDLDDGKYPITYTAYKNGTAFKTDNAYVRAGVQAPGFEFLSVIVVIGIAFLIWKRKKIN